MLEYIRRLSEDMVEVCVSIVGMRVYELCMPVNSSVQGMETQVLH